MTVLAEIPEYVRSIRYAHVPNLTPDELDILDKFTYLITKVEIEFITNSWNRTQFLDFMPKDWNQVDIYSTNIGLCGAFKNVMALLANNSFNRSLALKLYHELIFILDDELIKLGQSSHLHLKCPKLRKRAFYSTMHHFQNKLPYLLNKHSRSLI